jgi:Rrf2 family protein
VISQTAEYALRAVIWLARHPGQPISTQAIAAGTHVPSHYLSKVLQGLSRAGLVQSSPGRTGGFVLTREPWAITSLAVVDAVDPVKRILACPLGIHGAELCTLHRRLDDAYANLEKALAGSTIAELVPGPPQGSPLCTQPKDGAD